IVMSMMYMRAGGEENNQADRNNNNNNEDDGTVTIEHELDTAEVPKNPETVAVFDYGTLDTLDELEIDVAAVSQMNVPSYLEQYDTDDYENEGTLFEHDFEYLS